MAMAKTRLISSHRRVPFIGRPQLKPPPEHHLATKASPQLREFNTDKAVRHHLHSTDYPNPRTKQFSAPKAYLAPNHRHARRGNKKRSRNVISVIGGFSAV